MFSITRSGLHRCSRPILSAPWRSLHTNGRPLCQRSILQTLRETNRTKRTVFEGQRRNRSSESDRNSIGAFSPTAAALFIVAGLGLAYYFRLEKTRLEEEREKERELKSYGRPSVGGRFNLIDQDGKPFSEQNLLGKWSLVYFGFTNCPDICPAELDKVTSVLNKIQKEHGDIFLPVFISVDPARDPPSQIKEYLKDFHPSFVGLFGDYASTKAICKSYRVYFSTPPDADPKGDYLVDHSIFVYLMDPKGLFVEAFGQNVGADHIASKVDEAVAEWEKENGKKV